MADTFVPGETVYCVAFGVGDGVVHGHPYVIEAAADGYVLIVGQPRKLPSFYFDKNRPLMNDQLIVGEEVMFMMEGSRKGKIYTIARFEVVSERDVIQTSDNMRYWTSNFRKLTAEELDGLETIDERGSL